MSKGRRGQVSVTIGVIPASSYLYLAYFCVTVIVVSECAMRGIFKHGETR